ncbi:MAG: hypothetical protein ACK4I8_10260 [Armatimonadota bacterium]
MPLRYAPTLLISVDSGKMRQLVRQVWFWLNETQRKVLPIVRLGTADENSLQSVEGVQIGENLSSGLNRWLDEIAETENLSRLQSEGFEVQREPITRRIIVAFDSETPSQQAKSVLETISQLIKRREEPAVNLLVAVLMRSEGAQSPESLKEIRNWLAQNASQFANINLLVLDRYRSDGSNINPAQLPLVLTFLLLIALMPYEGDEHWLFSRGQTDKVSVRTAGIGILYVPLPQIAETAAQWLCHRLSPLALKEQPDLEFLEKRWEEMQSSLDESKLWRRLFIGLEDIGAELHDDQFEVYLPEGMVQLDLSTVPWDKWSERIGDWEVKWGLMLQEFWLPKVQENANKLQREVTEALTQSLDKCVANGEAIVATVGKLMERLLQSLPEWKSLKAPRGIKETKDLREKLDEAIHKVPNPYAIAARLVLIGSVIVYFTFAFARWSWLSGFIANWLRNFLPFVEAWMVPALIALLGFFALLKLIWTSWRIYDEAVRNAESLRDACISAVAEKVASILREAGLQALEQINQNLQGWAKGTNNQNSAAAKAVKTQLQNWEAKFTGFKADDYPLVRACVQRWGQLEPVFKEALQGKNYGELWRDLLKEAKLNSWEQWSSRWQDTSAVAQLEQAAEEIWKTQLQGEKVRKLSTYLTDETERKGMLQRCYDEASRFLWREVQSGTSLRWSLKPEGEGKLEDEGKEVLHQRYGSEQGWQSLTLPSIIGYLQVAQVEL